MTLPTWRKTFYLTHGTVQTKFLVLHKHVNATPAGIKTEQGTLKADVGFGPDRNARLNFEATSSEKGER